VTPGTQTAGDASEVLCAVVLVVMETFLRLGGGRETDGSLKPVVFSQGVTCRVGGGHL